MDGRPAVIIRKGEGSTMPETLVTESRSRGVLDTPPSRGMTTMDVVRTVHQQSLPRPALRGERVGVRGASANSEDEVRAVTPPHPETSSPTSPRKRGEVNH